MENIDKINLVWSDLKKWGRYKDQIFQINEKPDLGFEYFSLDVYDDQGTKCKTENGKSSKLTKKEMDSVLDFLSNVEPLHEKAILGVDEKGRYLDRVPAHKCYSIVWESPHNIFNYIWDFTSKSWKDAAVIDSTGKYVGNNVWVENFYLTVPTTPPTQNGPQKWFWNLEKNNWEDCRSVEEQKVDYLDQIDENYKRYLIQGLEYDPHMDRKYEAKYAEAKQYTEAGYPNLSPKYPYIYYECKFTGKTGKQVAESIIENFEKINLAIHNAEGVRLAAKQKLRNAETVEDMKDAVNITVNWNLFKI